MKINPYQSVIEEIIRSDNNEIYVKLLFELKNFLDILKIFYW